MIERYQIDLGAEKLKAEGMFRGGIHGKNGRLFRGDDDAEIDYGTPTRFTFSRRIMFALGEFCSVAISYNTSLHKIYFWGFRSDVLFAMHLINGLTDFAMRGLDEYLSECRAEGPMTAVEAREAQRSFLIGCASRISQALLASLKAREEREAQEIAKLPSERCALVVSTQSKRALVDADRIERGDKASPGSALTGASDRNSFRAGSVHGSGRAV